MASSYPVSVGAVQVGSYFVQQYYQVLQQQPDFVHHFYKDSSSMVRIDGDINESASAILQIHTLIMSLNFTGIEIKTINSLESWNGGVLVVVSGSVKSKEFSGWRKFMQSFFLAPQENGYFVLNDIFHFASDEAIQQHPVPVQPENAVIPPVTNDTPVPDSPAHHDYAVEIEPSEPLISVQSETDDAAQENNIQEEQQHPPPQPQSPESPQPPQQLQNEEECHILESSLEEETPVQESYTLPPENMVEAEPEPQAPAVEEPIVEPRKLTYASILQAPKGKYAPPVVASQPILNMSAAPASDWPQMPQPTAQPLKPISSFVPRNANIEVVPEEGLSKEEGESKSIYIRNLPTTISTSDILKEFMQFGPIKPDGVMMKNRKENGVCFAFVEFEDVESAQNAIKASPMQLEGRQVYIEERRANSTPSSRGGRGRGRGRGNYLNEGGRGRFGGRNFGRGTNQDGGDHRGRGNGVRGSY